jgi:hypothetical protein
VIVAAVRAASSTGKPTKGGKLLWRQLAARNEERLVRMEAPDWAQRW